MSFLSINRENIAHHQWKSAKVKDSDSHTHTHKIRYKRIIIDRSWIKKMEAEAVVVNIKIATTETNNQRSM